MSLFFIHGGPGFNSQPDRLILSDKLKAQGIPAVFWDEPSAFRPEGTPFVPAQAYTHWRNDLRAALEQAKPKLIVASSFGARGLTDLLRLHPQLQVEQILLLGPTMDLGAVFKRMMALSEKDLQSKAPDVARRLRECREGSQNFWDPLMQEGLGLVWQNPLLLTHYFENKETLGVWASVGRDPRFAIDMGSQVAVLNEMAQIHLPQLFTPLNIPITVLSGASDPVFNKLEVERELKPVFNHVNFVEWKGCGHCPQMEKPTEFIEFVKRLLNLS
ncbi:hypothetical protein AZI86_03940 [Bdellovibrio bacteriovorus]|uniref:AB hydrolase-1 domain-containing protein n=1 Tax=Bdellovibrio bacteriovorus TaxID=959 RepID=A0A150WP11_BDEBC|nr:alpha/beta hydrolase [Bdellovibrio bacteriovorus]KYG66222.1 hypothetical protein AZI86_03940 [Bdellovibrio bacteriovorus]